MQHALSRQETLTCAADRAPIGYRAVVSLLVEGCSERADVMFPERRDSALDSVSP